MSRPPAPTDPGLDAAAALSRAQAALANAGAAVATLGQSVVDAHHRLDRELAQRQAQLDRRDRELAAAIDRHERDDERRRRHLDARERDLNEREARLHGPHDDETLVELRRAYRRGYETGYARAKSGGRADVDRALSDPRNRYTTSRRAAPRSREHV